MQRGIRSRVASVIVGLVLATSVAPMTLAVDNQLPGGFHDGNEGVARRGECWAAGWAVDPDSPAERVTVRITVDGNLLTTVLADEFRQDLLDAGVSPAGNSSFFVYLGPLGVGFDASHSVLTEAQDLQTGEWSVLGSSPRSILCTNAGGFHDGNAGFVARADCYATGWATDWDTPGVAVTVRVKVDGRVVAQTSADEVRASPDPGVLPDGPYGWTIDLFNHMSSDVPHVVTAEMRDSTLKRTWIPLFETDKSLTCEGSSPTSSHGFPGTWQAVDCAQWWEDGHLACDVWGDGSDLSLSIGRGDTPKVGLQDSYASFCANNGSTATRFVASGYGTYSGGQLTPTYTKSGCGRVGAGGFVGADLYHDPGSDTLWEDPDGDGWGIVWYRVI